MIKHIIFILLTCAIPLWAMAQVNLVLNPSFEVHTECPYYLNQIQLAKYWSPIDSTANPDSIDKTPLCTPEYINSCATIASGVSAPSSYLYYHYPRTGNGMCEMEMYYNLLVSNTYFSSSIFYQRDYSQGRLSIPLTEGVSYCVTFYVALEPVSGYAVNHIGAYFDDGSIDRGFSDTTCYSFSYLCNDTCCAQPQIADTPQIVENSIILDTLGFATNDSALFEHRWVKIQGSFIAKGGEKFITIGNFSDFEHTDTAQLPPPPLPYVNSWGCCPVPPLFPYSAYLLDDISVVRSDAVADAGPDKIIHPRDSTWIGNDTAAVGGGDGMPCWWYKKGSTTAFDSGGRIRVHPDTTTTYIMMMDLCGHITYDTVTVNVWKLGISPSPTGSEVIVYPNPVQDIVQIKGLNTPATYKLCNMIGSTILQGILTNNSIDMSKLSSGVYVLTLTPQHTPDPSQEGNVVVRRIIKQ